MKPIVLLLVIIQLDDKYCDVLHQNFGLWKIFVGIEKTKFRKTLSAF